MEQEKIGTEDLNVLQVIKSRSEAALANAKASVAESKAADLEYRNQILRVFLKYGLSIDDGFDELTGVITRKQSQPAQTEAPPVIVEGAPTNG